MWEPFRQSLLAKHGFYVEQARTRLLSQFDRMEEEADAAAEAYLERIGMHFDPDCHDVGDFYESAHEKGIEFYQMLNEMRTATRLSVIADMFHQWDKQLRDWIVSEMRHWHHGEHVKKAIWQQDFPRIMDLLASFGWNPRSLETFSNLNAMRLVVNVFKHGDGKSLEDLKSLHPEYLAPETRRQIDWPLDFFGYADLQVTDDQIKRFVDAISNFWISVPAIIPLADEVNVPDWFEKAYGKDHKLK